MDVNGPTPWAGGVTLPRAVVVSIVALVTALASWSGALADMPPPAQVTSLYETATGNSVSRDCGYSAPLPSNTAQAFWAFCDTAIYGSAGELTGFIGGSTAAVGPYTAGQVPTGLRELPTPPSPAGTTPDDGAPAPFLPSPTGLLLPDGSTPCGSVGTGSYPASWITGLTRGPDRKIGSGRNGRDLFFLTYINVCVSGTLQWSVQSWGNAFYDPATNQVISSDTVFRREATNVDLGWQRQLGSPVFFSDGYLYLFAAHCDDAAFGACGAGRTILARTSWRSSTGWANVDSYRYWTASGWVASPAAAESIMPGPRPFAVDVNTYQDGRLALVEQTSIAGHYRLWRASSPTGPWTSGAEAVVPGCESSTTNWCYAFIGHPELSTTGSLLMSYYDPDYAHLRLAAVSW